MTECFVCKNEIPEPLELHYWKTLDEKNYLCGPECLVNHIKLESEPEPMTEQQKTNYNKILIERHYL